MVKVLSFLTVRDMVDAIKSYGITKQDIISVFPFDDRIVLMYEHKEPEK